MCTTLYRTKSFSTILKPLGSYTYAPKGLNYFYVRCSMVLISQCVRPCMVLNVLVRYWKFEYDTGSYNYDPNGTPYFSSAFKLCFHKVFAKCFVLLETIKYTCISTHSSKINSFTWPERHLSCDLDQGWITCYYYSTLNIMIRSNYFLTGESITLGTLWSLRYGFQRLLLRA